MYCPNCGTYNGDSGKHCMRCGALLAKKKAEPQPQEQPIPQPQPQQVTQTVVHTVQVEDTDRKFKDYLTGNVILAILGLVFVGIGWFGTIFAAVGIFFSIEAKTQYKSGLVASARGWAKWAKIMFIVALIIVIVTGVTYIFSALLTMISALVMGMGQAAAFAASAAAIAALFDQDLKIIADLFYMIQDFFQLFQ